MLIMLATAAILMIAAMMFALLISFDGNVPTIYYYASNLRIKKSIVEQTVRMPFEDTELPVPVGWDEYLRLFYGDDYMTPKRENYCVS